MTTVILRILRDPAGGLRGTVEKPGHRTLVFRDIDELVGVLSDWVDQDDAQVGNAWGSTSSSVIRET